MIDRLLSRYAESSRAIRSEKFRLDRFVDSMPQTAVLDITLTIRSVIVCLSLFRMDFGVAEEADLRS